jgi:succinylarginine dihydrolase
METIMPSFEVNFDGLVGPNYHHAGLAIGNLSSMKHAMHMANPRQAALQGLRKMKRLSALGVKQAILPPHPRPHLDLLRQCGFRGSTAQILSDAQKNAPALLMACYSASAMWVANSCTVSASLETQDHKVHFTPANLVSNVHRAHEAAFNRHLFKRIFAHPRYFSHHVALPAVAQLADEGAANHSRMLSYDQQTVVNLFVFGQYAFDKHQPKPNQFIARQTDAACHALARSHQLPPENTLFIQQNPAAIDQGVFHNDVIAVAHQHVLFCHERAFVNQAKLFDTLHQKLGEDILIIEVAEEDLPLELAIKSYLFNSQIVTTQNGSMALIAPVECYEIAVVRHFLSQLNADRRLPFESIHYVDCRESMRNGGGPACLRLRVVLTEEELAAVHPGVFLTDDLYQQLYTWVEQHYRDRLCAEDLADPQLIAEIQTALEALALILQLPDLYNI